MEFDEKSVKLERLYALHKNVMLYTAERILRDYQLAEDAVQKAFMKVYLLYLLTWWNMLGTRYFLTLKYKVQTVKIRLLTLMSRVVSEQLPAVQSVAL